MRITYVQHAYNYCIRTILAGCVLGSVCSVQAAERKPERSNAAGAPVLDAKGGRINYDRDKLDALMREANAREATSAQNAPAAAPAVNAFIPASAGEQQPFWQYSIFGSGIGASNIVIAPAPGPAQPPEIIVGGSSGSNFGGNDFWQVLKRNSVTGNYDQVFVSPIYTPTSSYYVGIKRIALANVIGDSALEIVVMLEDGRIFFYDFASKSLLGHFSTGASSLAGLSVHDLAGDEHQELIVTNSSDLFVYDAGGNLLWQVTGAGGSDVVIGQMDKDAALEIAATSGNVVDVATRAIQWTRSGGFGARVRLAPLPGATYQQLIAAESWDYIYSYDVSRQLPRWSIYTDGDMHAVRIADVDNDGVPEVLVGDGQWGAVRAFDLITQAQKWQVANPEHGVTDVAVGDVDADGVLDLLWGAGWTSSGADYLYVANTVGTRAIKWQSLDLQGPFRGPITGDLDGDGNAELVVCSFQSDSGYDAGRILVFDLATLALRGVSAPVVGNRAWSGVHDLKLRDLEGDGQMEIVLSASEYSDGVVEIHNFSAANVFTRKWINTTKPSGSPFNMVEVADLDGNGTAEIIATNNVAHSGSQGVYVYIFNYPATTNPWRSVNLASGFTSATGLVVQDLDGNGSKEIAALVANGDLYTFDGPTRQLYDLRQRTGFTQLNNSPSAFGLIGADAEGHAHFLQYRDEDHIDIFDRWLGTPLAGINEAPGGKLWTGAGGALTLRNSPYNRSIWQSPIVGTGFGRYVAVDNGGGENRVFSSARHAVMGFTYSTAPSELEAVAVTAHGKDILITFNAIAGRTFRLERKLSMNDETWQTVPDIEDITPARDGLAQFSDVGARGLPRASYRVVMLP